MTKKINWDEVFERYTKDGVLQKSYSAIARELEVTESAVRQQFKKRGVIDPRKIRTTSKFENGSKSKKVFDLRPDAFNSVKHGLYARVFWTEQGKQIYERLVKEGAPPDIYDAIYMLKAKIASGEIHKVRDVLNALEIMSKLYDKILGAERNEIERERLKHEAERVRILREKLELEKLERHLSDEDEIVVELGEKDEGEDKDNS